MEFKWKQELLDEIPFSKYKSVHINVQGYYTWGSGWNEQDKANFKKNIVDRLLTENGYHLTPSRDESSCDVLTGKGKYPFDKTSLYLHPMDIAGYATEETIQDIEKVLRADEHVTGFQVKAKNVYELSDSRYADFISNHAKEILAWFKENRRNDEFDFVRDHGLHRAFDKEALSDSRMDIIMVSAIRTIAKELGYEAKKSRNTTKTNTERS